MSELAYSSASQLARLIRAGAVSSRELTELYISRIERYDGDINAVVVRDFDNALAAADAADDALAKGEAAGPLHGVPMTIKESYNIAGLPTTFGQPAQAQNIATDDADVKMRAAAACAAGQPGQPIPRENGDVAHRHHLRAARAHTERTGIAFANFHVDGLEHLIAVGVWLAFGPPGRLPSRAHPEPHDGLGLARVCEANGVR